MGGEEVRQPDEHIPKDKRPADCLSAGRYFCSLTQAFDSSNCLRGALEAAAESTTQTTAQTTSQAAAANSTAAASVTTITAHEVKRRD